MSEHSIIVGIIVGVFLAVGIFWFFRHKFAVWFGGMGADASEALLKEASAILELPTTSSVKAVFAEVRKLKRAHAISHGTAALEEVADTIGTTFTTAAALKADLKVLKSNADEAMALVAKVNWLFGERLDNVALAIDFLQSMGVESFAVIRRICAISPTYGDAWSGKGLFHERLKVILKFIGFAEQAFEVTEVQLQNMRDKDTRIASLKQQNEKLLEDLRAAEAATRADINAAAAEKVTAESASSAAGAEAWEKSAGMFHEWGMQIAANRGGNNQPRGSDNRQRDRGSNQPRDTEQQASA